MTISNKATHFMQLPYLDDDGIARWRTCGCDCCSQEVFSKHYDDDDKAIPNLTPQTAKAIIAKLDEMIAEIEATKAEFINHLF